MPDRRAALEHDIELLEMAMTDCRPGELASLVREHRAALADLADLPNPAEVSRADEIAQRRAARRTSTAPASRAKRQG